MANVSSVSDALVDLGITEWVLRGEPTTEAEFNSMFRKVTGADDNGTAIESSDTDDFGVTWSQITAKQTALNNAAPMKELRRQRNIKLAETDFHGMSDNTMSDAMTTYRQALRDITTQTPGLDSDGNLTGITWPTKP
tara:strand:+ start:2387 stop:2797 length:411 start_codon:yes stop_codon:yes gene_type:complete